MSVYRGVLLYGDSGAGKSSLLNAGLMPLLIERGFAPVRVRVQPREYAELVIERLLAPDDPDSLPAAPNPASDGGDAASRMTVSVSGFKEYVAGELDGRRPFVIFDQFEELVTLFDTPPAQALQRRVTALIADLLHGPLRVKLLLAFRDDYLGKLKELLADCPELVDQALRLASPSVDALPTIISGPFDRYPDHFEHPLPGTVREKLIDALADRFGAGEVSLSEVQTVCLRLWQSDTPEALLEQRGVQGLLEDYLGEAIDQMPQQLQGAAIALLAQMITDAGTRNVISAADLFQRVREHEGRQTPATLEQALERLSQSRLVRRERRRDLDLYEITTEFLVPWISHRREEHRRRRERRRLTIVGTIAAAFVLLAAGVAGLALWALAQRQRAQTEAAHARTEATDARSLALASTAETMLPTRPDASLILALVAYAKAPQLAPVRASMVSGLEAAELSGALKVLHGAENSITSVAFAPRGSLLASASADGKIRIWNAANYNRPPIEVQPTSGSAPALFSVAFDPTGRTLAAGDQNGVIDFWSTVTWRPISRPLRVPPGAVIDLAFSPDDTRLAAVSLAKGVTLVPLRDRLPAGPSIQVSGTEAVRAVAFGPGGRMLATASTAANGNGALGLVDSASGQALAPTVPVDTELFTVTFVRRGGVAAGGFNGRLVLWRPGTSSVTMLSRSGGAINDLAVSPDGHTLAGALANDTVQLWSIGKAITRGQTLTGNTGLVTSVALSGRGTTLAAGSTDRTVRVWQTLNPAPLGAALPADHHIGYVVALAFSAGGGGLIAVGSRGIWQWRDPADAQRSGVRLTSQAASATAVVGQTLAWGNSHGAVWVWHLGHATPQRVYKDAAYSIETVALSPDGEVLAFAGDQGTIHVWSLADGRELRTIAPGAGKIFSLAFSPDGRLLASAGDDRMIQVWNAATGVLVRELTGDSDAIFSVAFSPGGTMLATGSADDTVRLWSMKTAQEIGQPLIGHHGYVHTIAFSPNGTILASGSEDGTVRLWDVRSQTQIGKPLQASTQRVNSVAFLPGGGVLAAGSGDGTVRLWPVVVLPSHFGVLRSRVCALVGDGLSTAEWSDYAPSYEYVNPCA